MILTTMDLENYKYQHLGMVTVTYSDALNPGRDIVANIKSYFGGRVGGYEKAADNVTTKAMDKLSKEAAALGCNAVIGIRQNHFTISVKGQTILLIAIYGAGVKILETSSLIEDQQAPTANDETIETESGQPELADLVEDSFKKPISEI